MEKDVTDKGKQIRVSTEVWNAILKEAKPITDTVDSVLRRKFGLPEKPKGKLKTDEEQGAVKNGTHERT